jgi:ABC-type transport system involved in multi-copper enzyme maturation permease subunit
MARRVFFLAANTFRETVRNKILYVILAFALVVISLTWFLADLSVGELSRIIVDVGLASIHLFGVIIAVFLGITLVSQEVERKTVYVILSKPVPRWEFVVGKAAGLGGTLFLTVSVMAALLFAMHAAYGGKAEPGILIASAGLYLELLLLVFVATFFSSFTTPTLSALFTLSFFLIGHVSGQLLFFGERAKGPIARIAAGALFHILPNLENFNWKNDVVYGQVRSPELLIAAVGYFASYGAALLLLACLIFSRKDFK